MYCVRSLSLSPLFLSESISLNLSLAHPFLSTTHTFALVHVPNVFPSTLTDAEDPDLDSLLADLCQLEEDTKAQLANATNAIESEKPSAEPPLRYVM